RLADVPRNLCVVGDPGQSIYRWRGADLRNILDFERDFPDAHIVKLEQNYRSTQVILDAASAVIQRNRNRRDKTLWTDRQGGDPILYARAGDEIEEADYIARGIRETQAGGGSGPRRRAAIGPPTSARAWGSSRPATARARSVKRTPPASSAWSPSSIARTRSRARAETR